MLPCIDFDVDACYFIFDILLCFLIKCEVCFREANAKAQRLLRFSQGQEMSDVVSQPTSSRVVGKAEHRFPQRDARQPSQSQKLLVDNSQLETMEAEPLGEDFSDTEAIVGTCEFMCSGKFL